MATAQGDIMIGSVKNMVDRLSKDFSAQKPPLTLPETKKNFNQFRHPQVVVTYAYKATQGDELSLSVGDTIEVLEEIEDGWSRGKNIKTGDVGAFPTNFVEAKSTPTTTVPPVLRPTVEDVEEPSASKRASSIIGFPRNSNFTEIPAKTKDAAKTEELPKLKEMAKVKFVYEPQNPDELKLGEIGALIEIVRKDCGDPGWFEGELNGKVGLFPDNFVELVQVPAGSTSGSPKVAAKVETRVKAPIQAPAPPAVPAKPKPKLSESNSSLNRIEPGTTTNTTTTVPPQIPASAKPSRNEAISSNFSDIRNKLAAGLPMFAPGDPAPAMSKSAMVGGSGDHHETSARPVSTSEISHETSEQPAQLDHITKGRPRGPGKRPTSMAVMQKKNSMEYLLESPTTAEPLGYDKDKTVLEKSPEISSPSSRSAALKPTKEEDPKSVSTTTATTTVFPVSSHSVREEPIKIRTFQPTAPLKLSPVAAAGDPSDQTPVSRKEYNDLLTRTTSRLKKLFSACAARSSSGAARGRHDEVMLEPSSVD